jgi:cysteine desulfurase
MNAALPMIYLDNNASTMPLPAVLTAMHECQQDCYGNPSSAHRLGQVARGRLNEARAAVAALIGAGPAQVMFTASATEGNHAAILGALARHPGRRRIITSTIEHPSTLRLFAHLEQSGTEVVRLAVDASGRLDLAALDAALDERVALVSLMWANNETGVCFPIEQIAAILHARGVLFHCDAVQAAGRLPVDLARVPIDLLTLSAHKVHGPKGAAALFVRKDLSLPPLLFGHQERQRRGGTENLPAIVGFGVAAAAARLALDVVPARVAALRDAFEKALLASHPGVRIHGVGEARVCNTSSVCFAGISGDELLTRLDRAGVFASGGAACTAGGGEPSHVLLAMGCTRDDAFSTLRFSLSRLNRWEELRHVLDLLGNLLPTVAARAA